MVLKYRKGGLVMNLNCFNYVSSIFERVESCIILWKVLCFYFI
jgi:hypothetical protein